jgi:ATP-dependent Clp protease ATP-binding subunit ClpB
VVLFKPLRQEELVKIVDLLTADLKERLQERSVTLELTQEAKTFIAREGSDPVYGARPLKRFIAHELETKIARMILKGELCEGSKLTVDSDGEKLTFSVSVSA